MSKFFGAKKSRIIFAADLPTSQENFRVLDEIQDDIDVIKISGFLAFKEGVGCVKKFRERYNKPIFADFKVADVPHTNEKIVQMVKDQGGSAVMVHGIIGIDGLESCLRAADKQIGIIVQIELTHPGGLIFTGPIALSIAKLAAATDVFGVQAPGNRPLKIAKIREIVGKEKTIVCCGVGFQGGSYQSVLKAGGDYPIIGRAIYESKTPKCAIQQLMKE
ncbi:MAG: orotidine-5'-phosphate decarboxylase [Chlamydiae bacterium]|nr:orotidine-5'-phosphate decarboxylase [Chlamydiota bacterium]